MTTYERMLTSPLGFPVEWDVCPGCGQPFAAQYRTFEQSTCDACAAPQRDYFAGVSDRSTPAPPSRQRTAPHTHHEALYDAVRRIAGKDRP
jgi:hypothetical protein